MASSPRAGLQLIQHTRHLRTEERRDDGGGASLAPEPVGNVALKIEAFNKPLYLWTAEITLTKKSDELQILRSGLPGPKKIDTCIVVYPTTSCCVWPEPLMPLNGFAQ